VISNAVAGLRKDGLNPEDRRTLLDIVDEEATRINRLVGDLLRYSRPVAPQRTSLPLAELLERSLGLISPDERSGAVKVVFQVDSTAPAVWGDSSLLRQVFDNLVGNAVQAMSSGGTLTVGINGLTMEGLEGVAVTISDTGEGMDTMVRNRARTPFFTTRPSGTGLGLAIVDRIIDAHGGTMTLDSQSGEGTTVSVFLPVGSENGPPPAPRSRMDSTASFLPPRGGRA
jgi:signal transduction histidine kinase